MADRPAYQICRPVLGHGEAWKERRSWQGRLGQAPGLRVREDRGYVRARAGPAGRAPGRVLRHALILDEPDEFVSRHRAFVAEDLFAVAVEGDEGRKEFDLVAGD